MCQHIPVYNERKMGSYSYNTVNEDVSIPATQHFHPGVCAKCYTVQPSEGQTLMRCSQCQLVPYCSKACQKKDWPSHKRICFVNKVLNNKNIFQSARDALGEIKEFKCWFSLLTDLALTCSINLNKSLTVKEREMFLYPKVCEVCKEAKSSILQECERCHSVFYCSRDHRETDESIHKPWCDSYLLCLECDSVEAMRGIQDLPFPTLVDVEYVQLPSSLMALLDPQLTVDPEKTLDHRFVTMIAERLSYPLSLLYAFEKLQKKPTQKSFCSSSELCIHVIGAETSVELLGIIRWEYLLHRLPSLKTLRIVFVGPDLLKSEDATETEEEFPLGRHCLEDTGSTRCSDCIENGRFVNYEMVSMLYHEYEQSGLYSSPDALIAFNCGFHEFIGDPADTWNETLQHIIKMCVPLIFTSYTSLEAKKDLKTVMDIDDETEILIEMHLNPFCSPRPVREAAREDGNQLFFHNQYLACIRGS